MYFILFALILEFCVAADFFFLFRAEKCEAILLLAFHCIRYLITFWRFYFFHSFSLSMPGVLALARMCCCYFNRLNCAMHCAYAPKSHLHYLRNVIVMFECMCGFRFCYFIRFFWLIVFFPLVIASECRMEKIIIRTLHVNAQ